MSNDEKSPKRVGVVGLIVAAVLVFVGIGLARDLDVGTMALPYFTTALALGIRSVLPGRTWGRQLLAALGGFCLGWTLLMLALVSPNDRATLIGPSLFTVAFLWYGFKRGKIQWKKKKKEAQ